MISLNEIGKIVTPYSWDDQPPFWADDNTPGTFYLEVFPEYEELLYKLETFSHIHVIFYVSKSKPFKKLVTPPLGNGMQVGLFASRSPNRPNPLALSTVQLLQIEGNKIFTSCIDAYNDSPLIDIKPYIPRSDIKQGANAGWLDEFLKK